MQDKRSEIINKGVCLNTLINNCSNCTDKAHITLLYHHGDANYIIIVIKRTYMKNCKYYPSISSLNGYGTNRGNHRPITRWHHLSLFRGRHYPIFQSVNSFIPFMKTIETLVFPFKHFSLTKKTTGTKRQAKCLIKLKEKNTSTPEKVHRKKSQWDAIGM